MTKPKKNHARAKKGNKKTPSKYKQEVKINASFEELLKMAAEGQVKKGSNKK